MSDYRRRFRQGGMYFFTVVSYNRRPILTSQPGRELLRGAIERIQAKRPFSFFATVLIPDHWHCIMELPRKDDGFSLRLKRIKEEFTASWLGAGLPEEPVTDSQRQNGERGVWQPRFWEHLIRNEDELERFTDYIHWNPRKHNLVRRVRDWPYSSFHRFVADGHYDINWGGDAPKSIVGHDDWGEP